MKRIIFGLMIILSFSMVGCAKEKTETVNTKQETTKEIKQEKTEDKKDEVSFPADAKETGNGKYVLYCDGGNSENGNIPKILLNKNQKDYRIELVLSKFDSSKFTYIFVNKKYMDKVQVPLQVQHGVRVKNPEFIKDGTYTVSIIQFKDDTMKEMTEYHEVKYEIKH